MSAKIPAPSKQESTLSDREWPPMYFRKKMHKGFFDGLEEAERFQAGKPGVMTYLPQTEIDSLISSAIAKTWEEAASMASGKALIEKFKQKAKEAKNV